MSSQPIDRAYVQFEPQTDDFERKLVRQIDRALRRIEAYTRRTTRFIERSFDNATEHIVDGFERGERQATRMRTSVVRDLRSIETAASRIDVDISTDTAITNLRTLQTTATSVFTSIRREIDDTGDHLDRVFARAAANAGQHLFYLQQGAERHFRAIREDADTTGDHIGRQFVTAAATANAALATIERRIVVRVVTDNSGVSGVPGGGGTSRDGAASGLGENPQVSRGRNLVDQLGRTGSDAGTTFGKNFLDTAGGLIGGPVLGTLLVAALAGVALAAGTTIITMIGSILTTGIGLLGIGLGVALAAQYPEVQKGFTDFIDRAKSIFADTARPLIEPINNALSILGDTLEIIEPGLRDLFKTLAKSGIIETLAAAFGDFVVNIMPGFLTLVEAAIPLIESFAYNFSYFGGDISDFFITLSENIPTFIRAMTLFFNILSFVFDTLGFVFDQSAAAFDRLHAAAMVAGEVFDTFRELISNALEGVWLIVQKYWQLIVAIFTGDTEKLSQLLTEWLLYIKTTFQMLGDLIPIVAGIFAGIARVAWEKISGLPDKVSKWLHGLGNMLRDAGAALLQGFINGIESKIPSLTGLLNKITSMMPLEKGPIEKDRTLLEPNGEAIMQGLHRGITGEEPRLYSMLNGMTDDIESSVSVSSSSGGGSGPIIVQLVLDGNVIAQEIVIPIVQKNNRKMARSISSKPKPKLV